MTLSQIIKLCYIAKPQNRRRWKFSSFVRNSFEIDLNINHHCVYINMDMLTDLNSLGGAYKKAAMEFLNQNPHIKKDHMNSNKNDWVFYCMYNLNMPNKSEMIQTTFRSVFALIDTSKVNTFWFNGNLKPIHSFKQIDDELQIKVQHLMDSYFGISKYFFNPFYHPTLFYY